jgi:AraC family transcriptional regulator of adaptative response / DNA-3-methyladenine glycosylase II
MRPYSHAAAAEADGFRPCLRCRPDRVPERGWIDGPELVCRAMRAVAAGALDGATEDVLAARLGISARHLRRLFDAHVGATPSQVARSRRAHFARRLLDDTDLPVTRVAEAAGFASVRQLNRVVMDVFRFTPTELRAKRQAADRSVVDGGLVLHLPYRPPLAWDAVLAFLAPRAIPGVEAVDLATRTYRRTVSLGGYPGAIEVWDEPARGTLGLRAHLPDFAGLVHLVARVRALFDLDADPAVVDAALARDRGMRAAVRRRPGVRVPGAIAPLEVGVRAVLGQQISVAAATRLAGRLVDAFGTPVAGLHDLGLTHVFPAAETLATADLAAIGVPRRRARAVAAVAGAISTGALDGAAGRGQEALVGALEGLPGVGPWTAQYVAMRGFGERDAIPLTDLGLRRAFGDVAARAARWRPWRAYGAMHGWLGPPPAPGR